MLETDFQLVTFDCYGTLIDWESGIVAAFKSEAARDGIELNANDIVSVYMDVEPVVESQDYIRYREVLAQTALRVAQELGWKITRDRAIFLADSVPEWRPFPDTNPALERLARRYQLGILSNIDDDLLAATRKHFTVEFDFVVTAEQVRSYKPGPAHFHEVTRRAGGKRILHAAQSYFHDVVPSRELGIPVVWVNRKDERAEEGGPSPTHEVSNLAELADLLGV